MYSERLYLLVVGFLGLCALTALAGMVAITVTGREVPASLATVLGTALGALGGLLSQPPHPPAPGPAPPQAVGPK